MRRFLLSLSSAMTRVTRIMMTDPITSSHIRVSAGLKSTRKKKATPIGRRSGDAPAAPPYAGQQGRQEIGEAEGHVFLPDVVDEGVKGQAQYRKSRYGGELQAFPR